MQVRSRYLKSTAFSAIWAASLASKKAVNATGITAVAGNVSTMARRVGRSNAQQLPEGLHTWSPSAETLTDGVEEHLWYLMRAKDAEDAVKDADSDSDDEVHGAKPTSPRAAASIQMRASHISSEEAVDDTVLFRSVSL